MVADVLHKRRTLDSGCPWLHGMLTSKRLLNAHGTPASPPDSVMSPFSVPDCRSHDSTIQAA